MPRARRHRNREPAPMSKKPRDNDFTVKVANVNGTGSASANSLLMKSFFRMGIPVAGKNYFPSNIQGLPTWYEIRVSKDAYICRSGRVDVMVAMNAETYRKDLSEVAPGGYLIYDSTWPRMKQLARDDITILGVPLAKMCNEHFTKARERVLMKNIAYVGVLAALLEIDMEVVRKLLQETFGDKPHLLDSNQAAIDLGFNYARENFSVPAAVPRAEHGPDRRAHHDRRQHHHGPRRALRRRHGRRLVPDHAVHLGDGRVQALCRALPQGSGDRQAQRRGHPGRGRARGHRHGARRELERRAGLYADQRPRHLADERVPGLWLLHRDPRCRDRRAALRPVHRHADPHPAGRHHGLRLCFPRRHAPRAAVPRQPGGGVLPRAPRPSTLPSGCRRRSSFSPTSTSA